MAGQRTKKKNPKSAQDQASVDGFPFLSAADDEQPSEEIDLAQAFPSIEVAAEKPAAAPKRKKAAKKAAAAPADVDAEEEFDNLYAADNRVNVVNLELERLYRSMRTPKSGAAQPEQKSAFNTAADIQKLRVAADRYPNIKAQPKKLTLYNETSAITIERAKIGLVAPPAKKGQVVQAPVLDDAAGDVMVLFAAKNPLMMAKGIKLNGTEEQQAILRAAVERYNEAHPDAQLKIQGQAPVKALDIAAQAPVPQKEAIAEQREDRPAVEKQEMPVLNKEKKTGLFKRIGSVLMRGKAKADAQEIEPIKTKKEVPQKEKLENPSRRNLFRVSNSAVAEKTELELKDAAAPVAGHGQVVAEAKAEAPDNDNAVAEAVQKAAPMTRRKLVGGAIAALAAAVVMQPDDAHAFFFKKDPEATKRMLETRKMLGLDPETGKPLKNGSQKNQSKKGKSNKPPKGETRKQRLAREKREKAEARQRLKEHKARQKQEAREEKERQRSEARQAKEDTRKNIKNGKRAEGGVYLYNVHNGEKYFLKFNDIGSRSCKASFNKFARDWRNGQMINMDDGLLLKIESLCTHFAASGKHVQEINILSAHRSKQTNEMLRKTRGGAAQHSLHISGKALDIQIDGVSTSTLYNACCKVAGQGGVGKYTKSGFVHIDTGNHRRWGS